MKVPQNRWFQQCPFGKNRGAGDWYAIYHHLPVVKGVGLNPSINQPTNGNLGHLWIVHHGKFH